jgi:hypothetical protein
MSEESKGIERELRERFARLRHEEGGAAPEFGALLRRPVGEPPRRATGPRLIRLVLAAAAIAVIAVGLSRIRRPDPGYAIDLSSTSWHGPTDFLLVFPDDESLRSVPRLGEMDLNWRTP